MIPRYLDGPTFIRFLQSEGIEISMLTDAQQRKWRAWQRGIRADSMSDSLDKLLTQYGLPHSYIPDECWAADQSNHQSRTGPRPGRSRMNAKRRAARRAA